MTDVREDNQHVGGDDTEAGSGVVVRDGERYLNIERAAAYLGKSRATVWNYLRRYGKTYDIQTYMFPLFGKRAFLRQGDLDRLKNAGPLPRVPTEPTRKKGTARGEP